MKTNIDKKLDKFIEGAVKKELDKIDFDVLLEKVALKLATKFKKVRRELTKEYFKRR